MITKLPSNNIIYGSDAKELELDLKNDGTFLKSTN